MASLLATLHANLHSSYSKKMPRSHSTQLTCYKSPDNPTRTLHVKSFTAAVTAALMTICIATLLVACGFQLKGTTNWPETLDTLALTYQPTDLSLKNTLVRQLQQAGATLDDNAQYRLIIHQFDQKNQVTSYNTQGRPQQYTMSIDIAYEVIDTVSSESLSSNTLSRSRSYTFDSNQISGFTQEQRLLATELQRDLIFQLIGQLTRLVQPLESDPSSVSPSTP